MHWPKSSPPWAMIMKINLNARIKHPSHTSAQSKGLQKFTLPVQCSSRLRRQ